MLQNVHNGAGRGGSIRIREGNTHNGRTLRLLLASEGEARTLMHVLVGEDSNPNERIAALRAAEMLRRAAQGIRRARAGQ